MKKTKKIEDTQFNNWIRMCRKSAWYFAKKYAMEYADVEAQSFLIYVRALEKWDSKKSSFSTHLTVQLRALGDYCKKVKKEYHADPDTLCEDGSSFYFDSIEGSPALPSLVEFLQAASTCVSKDVHSVLEWLLYRQWDFDRYLKPSVNVIVRISKKEWGWTKERAIAAWEELGNCWMNGTLAEFAL